MRDTLKKIETIKTKIRILQFKLQALIDSAQKSCKHRGAIKNTSYDGTEYHCSKCDKWLTREEYNASFIYRSEPVRKKYR